MQTDAVINLVSDLVGLDGLVSRAKPVHPKEIPAKSNGYPITAGKTAGIGTI